MASIWVWRRGLVITSARRGSFSSSSSSSPREERRTQGGTTWRMPGRDRTNAKPSSPGICRSVRSREKGRPSLSAAHRAWRALGALSTLITSNPRAFKTSSSSSRLGATSSTTRTRFPGITGVTLLSSVSSASGAIPAGIATEKVVPSPKRLCTAMLPPMRSTSWRLMDRPSPVPWYRRDEVLSAWEKGSKIRD